MSRCSLVAILLAVLATAATRSSAQGECLYQYIQQPPMILGCNPYARMQLAIRCQARVPAQSGVRIQWLKRNFVNEMEIESQIENTQSKYMIEIMDSQNEQFLVSRLTILNPDDADAGMYQCVMVLNNRTRLQPSQPLILLISDGYNEVAACSDSTGTHTVDLETCVTLDLQQATAMTPPMDTTTTEEGGSDGPTEPDSGSLATALYIVVAVIVVFVLIIVSLAVAVVVLYRRKVSRGSANVKGPQGSNAYDGLHRSFGNSGYAKDDVQQPSESGSRPSHRELSPPAPPTSSSRDAITDSIVYNHLVREVPANFSPASFNQSEYSQLGPRSETTPPTVPLPPGSTVPPPQRLAKPLKLPASPQRVPTGEPPVSIYRTLEDSAEGESRGPEPDTLAEPERTSDSKNQSASNGTQWSEPDGVPDNTTPSAAAVNGKSSPDRTLFDDPEYSPLKTVQSKVKQLREPQYLGDYERDPTYVPPSAQVRMSAIDPKYRGDYERDSSYLPKPPPRRHSTDAIKPPPAKRSSQESGSAVNYKGDYERDPHYVPPALRSGSSSSSGANKPPLAPKYSGDYERDPSYMASKLSASNRITSVEYSYPSFPEDDLVPPHIPHEYQALADMLKDPPQQYARLNSAEPVDVTENEA